MPCGLCCGLNFKHPYGRSLQTRHLSLGLVRLAKSSDVDQLLQALLHHFANPAHHDLPTSEEKSADFSLENPPTRVGVHSFFSYVASKILSQGAHPKSPVQNPKSKIPKIQNPKSPKSKIPKIQNPQSPNSKIQTLHIKVCYIMFQKSKIQNPQNPENPKSKIPKIQNPKSPKSKIQNPHNPKSKIPKIQNPQNPKSPKSKLFWRDFGDFEDFGFWGFWIWDSGPKIQNPNSPTSKIQNPQNPKSPKSKILRQNPKFGALGASRKELLHNDPKSKIPKIRPKKFGFWILGILDFGDFGFWIFGILDFGDFGFWGFWDFGDFGFWILGILDFGILGILDFGDFGFWGFWILGFWGGPGDVPLGNLVTVPGGQRLESPLVCLWGPLQNQLYRIELGQGSKLNIFSEVRTLQNHRKTLTSNPEVRTLQNHRKT